MTVKSPEPVDTVDVTTPRDHTYESQHKTVPYPYLKNKLNVSVCLSFDQNITVIEALYLSFRVNVFLTFCMHC
jgi:hypothetical protein